MNCRAASAYWAHPRFLNAHIVHWNTSDRRWTVHSGYWYIKLSCIVTCRSVWTEIKRFLIGGNCVRYTWWCVVPQVCTSLGYVAMTWTSCLWSLRDVWMQKVRKSLRRVSRSYVVFIVCPLHDLSQLSTLPFSQTTTLKWVTVTLPESWTRLISLSTADWLKLFHFLQFVLLLSDRHLEFHAQVRYTCPGYWGLGLGWSPYYSQERRLE